MAYYLAQRKSYDPTGLINIRLPQNLTVGANIGDYIEVEAASASDTENSNNTYRYFGRGDSFTSKIEFQPSQIQIRAEGATFSFPAAKPGLGSIHTIRVERTSSGVWDCLLDGASVGTGNTSNNFVLSRIFCLTDEIVQTFVGDLYRAEICNDGTGIPNYIYDPSASGGSGLILPETASNEDATLSGSWPTDDSQWVFYAAGGGDSATTVGVESASEVGTPSVGQNHSLTTNGVESDSEVGAPSVGQNHSLSTNGVESASEVGNPAVGQNHSLTKTGIESASQVGTPTAGEVAGGDSAVTVGLESASETGTPSVGQNHVLSTNGLDSESEVGQPSVGQVHILSSTGIESASTVGNPTALSVTGLLLGIKPSLSISVTEYSVTLAAPVYSFTVSQPKYTIQVTQPNYTVIQ